MFDGWSGSAWLSAVHDKLPLSVELQSELLSYFNLMQSGGLIMFLLTVIGLVLGALLGARAVLLGFTSTGSARLRMKRLRKNGERGRHHLRGVLNQASADLWVASRVYAKPGLPGKFACDFVARHYQDRLKRFGLTIKTLVIVAPLLGLLGTIVGMIETFEALRTSAVFGQGSSIAGGISKALFTTQMGLVVAIPALLIGRLLERRERVLRDHLEQLSVLALRVERT